MQIVVTPDVVRVIKNDLRSSLSGLKSSHRAEAIARGLGWRTNAAMLADIHQRAPSRLLCPERFHSYLAERGMEADGLRFKHAVLRAIIRAIMDADERLTHFGFGLYNEGKLSPVDWEKEYAKERSALLSERALGEFERAYEYLSMLDRTKAPNRRLYSYRLKHCAERFHRARGIDGRWEREYVANGSIIAAAYHLGLQVRRAHRTSMSANFNVSGRSVRTLDDASKLAMP